MPQSNLLILLWCDDGRIGSDLERIAARVCQLNPEINARVVPHRRLSQIMLLPLWPQPTLSLSLLAADRKLLPGRYLTGSYMPKHTEYPRLEAAGVPVPKWTVIAPDTRLDPAEWGPYVVEKPSSGWSGACVRIRKTGRVRYVAPENLPHDHRGRFGPMLAQRFVYSGPWPTTYRVITFFGEVLLSYRQTSQSHGPALGGRWNFKEFGGINICSNTRDMTVQLAADDEIIALAERAHRAAFPDFPALAFDIVRDADTGDLFVLECNPQGTWLFSAAIGLSIQAVNDIKFENQFDAIEKAARILARETPSRSAIAWPRRERRASAGGDPTRGGS